MGHSDGEALAFLASSSPPWPTLALFIVQGRVFCDTCLAGFDTSASSYIHRARMRVECNDDEILDMIDEVEGVTDETGTYKIAGEGDHDGQLCEVVHVSSLMSECATIEQGRERARVYTTSNNGIASSFLKDSPLAGCAQLLKQYQDFEFGKEYQGSGAQSFSSF